MVGIIKKVAAGSALAGGISVALMFGCVVAEVFSRYVLNRPLIWVADAAEMTLIVVAYLCLAFVEQERGHVRVDIVLRRLKGKAYIVVDEVGLIMSCILAFLIVWQGLVLTLEFYEAGTATMTALLPKWPFTAFIPLGGMFYLMVVLVNLVTNAQKLFRRNPPIGRERGG